MDAGDYMDAVNFVNNLNATVRALQQPGVGGYFNGKYAIKAASVPQLVQFMRDKGLRFAPATPGDDAAYAALHTALANYYALSRPVARDGGAK
jgi:hypothetical protein